MWKMSCVQLLHFFMESSCEFYLVKKADFIAEPMKKRFLRIRIAINSHSRSDYKNNISMLNVDFIDDCEFVLERTTDKHRRGSQTNPNCWTIWTHSIVRNLVRSLLRSSRKSSWIIPPLNWSVSTLGVVFSTNGVKIR